MYRVGARAEPERSAESRRHLSLAAPAGLLAAFVLAYTLPFEGLRASPVREALLLLQDYARHHVLLCLVPALFIAGAIAALVSQGAVVRYLGAGARKVVAYGVASVSGTILAACSCTVLPLFAGIRQRGAGLGPAVSFLYAGPAINVLAIILTARVLGWELGLARAVAAIALGVLVGVAMHLLFRREEQAAEGGFALPEEPPARSPAWTVLFFAALVGLLVFANWTKLSDDGFAAAVWSVKWPLAGACLLLVLWISAHRLSRGERREWLESTWTFTGKIVPLLFLGVLFAGLLLGRPGHPGLVPESWVASAVGGNGVGANLFASVAGALMYFATLTEVPILQGLLGAGMGEGPALALLLAGPALSLPNILVIRSLLGTRKTLAYVGLVVGFSSAAGLVYGGMR